MKLDWTIHSDWYTVLNCKIGGIHFVWGGFKIIHAIKNIWVGTLNHFYLPEKHPHLLSLNFFFYKIHFYRKLFLFENGNELLVLVFIENIFCNDQYAYAWMKTTTQNTFYMRKCDKVDKIWNLLAILRIKKSFNKIVNLRKIECGEENKKQNT